jgi:hypothetical protein
MSTLSQPSLFSWKDFDGSPEIERLRAILDHLPDAALLDALVAERKKKRNDYPIEALWRSTIAGLLFGHQTTACLIRELERNAELRLVCGFDEVKNPDPKKQWLAPPDYVYSRFYGKVAKHWNLIEEMFDSLLDEVAKLLPDFGRKLAADSKAIPVFGSRPADADTGTKEYVDADGYKKISHWFGYKLHLIVDAIYELPIAFKVTKASANDSPLLMPMVRDLKEKHSELYERVESLAADKGYDDGADKAELYDDHGITPLIPPRNMLGQKDDPIRPLDPDRHDTIYAGPTGEIYCRVAPMESDPEKAFASMRFMGFEKKRGTLKFRCPAAAFGIECHNRDACRCAPRVRDGKYGRVVRVPLEKNRRIYLPQHFHSQGFKAAYKKRTSVERVNNRLDNVHGFEHTHLRSLDRIQLRAGLVMIIMLASARSWILAGKEKNIRRILRPAA